MVWFNGFDEFIPLCLFPQSATQNDVFSKIKDRSQKQVLVNFLMYHRSKAKLCQTDGDDGGGSDM